MKYKGEASSFGLPEAWVRAVFVNKKTLPVLDSSFDVHGTGVNILDMMGIAKEIQTLMWQNWSLLDDDIKASWVEDFKRLDFSESLDVTSYTQLLIDLLS